MNIFNDTLVLLYDDASLMNQFFKRYKYSLFIIIHIYIEIKFSQPRLLREGVRVNAIHGTYI